MSDDYGDHEYFEDKEPQRRRDRKIDEAKIELMARFFSDDSTGVYYGRQLEIWLEDQFFHWITKKALNELVAELKIRFEEVSLQHHVAHFYFALRHRYPRRQINQTLRLIAEFSEPIFHTGAWPTRRVIG